MNKKIVFGENGEVVSESKQSIKTHQNQVEGKNEEKNSLKKRNHQKKSRYFGSKMRNSGDIPETDNEKWFDKFAEFNNTDEITELKENELSELIRMCKTNYESLLPRFVKNNPGDYKWLETALHRGTAKDRANAGALLVQSNSLGNLSALETLIGFSKHSNKTSSDVLTVLTDVFVDALLPSDRKLLSIAMRGTDWKTLQKREDITQDLKNLILSYWHFENEVKQHYFEFLKNLQQAMQIGQDANKSVAIICGTKLLLYGPEKEQMLLSMLINKLGDPSSKVASKALHYLTELAYKHPNMCGVIINETEKLLFRNNISERAQHFALSFLSQIAPRGRSDVCTKLVNICFSFFKILVQKGAVNNKTMQAILRCLQKSIVDAKSSTESGEIMNKEMQDTIYRLVHLADIKISIQTLSLLLQMITVKSENSDRFYNALYKKLLDLDLTTIGNNAAAQFLHIVHRSIHIDQNVQRAQAFIKRLLQLALYLPSQMACGTLIIISKLLKMRPDLSKSETANSENQILLNDEILAKFDSDGDEKYEDVHLDEDNDDKDETNLTSIKNEPENEVKNENAKEDVKPIQSSWHHSQIFNIKNEETKSKEKVSQIEATKYDPYHRVPMYAGAEYALKTELLLLKDHYHPTVKVFAENILNRKKIDYYGDPLKDFGLTHFLERFSFKNPKKVGDKNPDSVIHILHNKTYVPYGGRGKPVKSLTKENCTEDELFIFNYLEKKRNIQAKLGITDKKHDDDEDIESVDDEEFEKYLDSLCKKSKKDTEENDDDDDDDDFDVDYLKELGDDIQDSKIKRKQKKKAGDKEKDDDDDEDAIENDWGDDDDFDGDKDFESEDDIDGDDEEDLEEDDSDSSIPLNESDLGDSSDENGSENDLDENESEDDEPKSKKPKKSMNKFSKILKNQTDMSSLFAAADDFAELLEDTGKIKGHGTLNAVSNQDKSSAKQLKWEEKRRSGLRNFKSKGRPGKVRKNKKK